MKRLSVVLLLLMVVSPCYALDVTWIQAHSDLWHFENAEWMCEQQQDFDMYELNSFMWGEHPSAERIFWT